MLQKHGVTFFSERIVEGIYPHSIHLLNGLPEVFPALDHWVLLVSPASYYFSCLSSHKVRSTQGTRQTGSCPGILASSGLLVFVSAQRPGESLCLLVFGKLGGLWVWGLLSKQIFLQFCHLKNVIIAVPSDSCVRIYKIWMSLVGFEK